MSKASKIATRILSIIAAVILLQTLYFKFSAHPESVYLFTQLGMEPWGRIGVGVFELITGILLLYPRTTNYGSLLGLGVIAGAIYFHLFVLGIVVQNDGGALFALALAVFVSCLAIVLINRKSILADLSKLLGKGQAATEAP